MFSSRTCGSWRNESGTRPSEAQRTQRADAGFSPSSRLGVVPPFTAVIRFEALPRGTKYTAMAIHGAEAHAAKHQGLGFYDGWGTVTDQLIALVTKS